MGIRAVVRRVLSTRSPSGESGVARPEGDRDGEGAGAGEGFRAWLRRLDAEHPHLSRWVGGRLDIEVPAIIASVVVHAVFLLALASAGYAVHVESQKEFKSAVVDTALPANLGHVDFQDLDQSAEPPSLSPAAGSFAPNLGAMNISAPPSAMVDSSAVGKASAPVDLAKLDVRRATEMSVPTANMLGQTVSIAGNGAEHAGGVEGAVDRVANEVVRHLEKGRTLVVWAFDASGSLVVERERLSKHIDTVYTHVLQMDQKSLASDGGLLTMVVGFGHDRKAMTPHPTADKDEIISAINSIPIDTTGVESTFQTVGEICHRWGRYKDSKGHVYHTMVIVVTDEVGDDENYLEDAIAEAKGANVPVYVLGSQAIFGRIEGYMDYTDPKTKQTFHHLPVRQGPESIKLEQIRLPFWYDGPQYEVLDAGFGPYALSRLAGATGGIYFITRMGGARLGFDPASMQEYKPDWVSQKKYELDLQKSPIRNAVLQAALLTQQQLPGQPGLTFPSADSPEFKEAMARNQETVARIALTVDEALVPITQAVKYRDKEPSRRWQAHYDLARGRLLAMKIRCYEYNSACAKMKKDAPKFTKPNSNAWRLVPDDEIRFSDKAAAAAKEAKSLLKRVVEEHPGTPWALLAQREMKDALGFNWVETYVKPIVRNQNESAEAKKKKKEMPKPVKPMEVPKL